MCRNLRSLPNKIDELSALLKVNFVDTAVVTESWLDEQIPDSLVNISGYKIIRNDRCGKRGGGVVNLVRENANRSVFPNFPNEDIQSVCVTLKHTRMPRDHPNVTTGAIYHPPNANNYVFTQHISRCLENTLKQPLSWQEISIHTKTITVIRHLN